MVLTEVVVDEGEEAGMFTAVEFDVNAPRGKPLEVLRRKCPVEWGVQQFVEQGRIGSAGRRSRGLLSCYPSSGRYAPPGSIQARPVKENINQRISSES